MQLLLILVNEALYVIHSSFYMSLLKVFCHNWDFSLPSLLRLFFVDVPGIMDHTFFLFEIRSSFDVSLLMVILLCSMGFGPFSLFEIHLSFDVSLMRGISPYSMEYAPFCIDGVALFHSRYFWRSFFI